HGYARPGAGAAAGADEVRALTVAGAALAMAGFEAPVLSAGSTPTVRHSSHAPVTEERPGTYIFGDRQQAEPGRVAPADVAPPVAATVISDAVPGQVVVDSGAKALAKDRPEWLDGHGVLPAYPGALVRQVFDFHAVVALGPDGRAPRLGEVVWIVPNHACA